MTDTSPDLEGAPIGLALGGLGAAAAPVGVRSEISNANVALVGNG